MHPIDLNTFAVQHDVLGRPLPAIRHGAVCPACQEGILEENTDLVACPECGETWDK